MTREEFLMSFFQITWDYDDHDSWFWRVDDGNLKLMAVCSDFFYWGCADGEEITTENISELRQAYADCEAVDRVVGTVWGPQLFCARLRKLRPQGACYKDMPLGIAELFNKCGPEREVTLGNPYPPAQ